MIRALGAAHYICRTQALHYTLPVGSLQDTGPALPALLPETLPAGPPEIASKRTPTRHSRLAANISHLTITTMCSFNYKLSCFCLQFSISFVAILLNSTDNFEIFSSRSVPIMNIAPYIFMKVNFDETFTIFNWTNVH